MNALSESFRDIADDLAVPGQVNVYPAALKWAALQDSAEVVAAMADLPGKSLLIDSYDFPTRIAETGRWRRELAERAIEDLRVVMEAGIEALLGVIRCGGNPTPAARALWNEFVTGRRAILALIPEQSSMKSPEGEPIRAL
ncbi:hypothetical protein [Altericroceibacterium endophyticum]|uniref:Uncharacterized protein n=1 Tax=Altericroceibacterium endophyticum TaxID=1808508 RepID=A0A6I4T493_9SPHN|nr:hypothetical protein [Altericroceibacterium endophyticum]MXO65568.1 hypothetical protein [Altericroceibacterium endophyticum]